MKKTAAFALVVLLLLGVTFLLGRQVGRNGKQGPVPVISDTLYVRDTIRIPTPHYVKKEIVDTFLVPVVDTLRQRDTLFVQVHKEQKKYTDDSTYTAYVSGYRPSLDSIDIYRNTKVITNTVTVKIPRKWNFGVQVGVGGMYTLDRKIAAGAYVGYGFTYNF